MIQPITLWFYCGACDQFMTIEVDEMAAAMGHGDIARHMMQDHIRGCGEKKRKREEHDARLKSVHCQLRHAQAIGSIADQELDYSLKEWLTLVDALFPEDPIAHNYVLGVMREPNVLAHGGGTLPPPGGSHSFMRKIVSEVQYQLNEELKYLLERDKVYREWDKRDFLEREKARKA
jgi:hypothetical protein